MVDRHIRPDLVAKLETIGHRLCRRVDVNPDPMDHVFFDCRRERRTGPANDPECRSEHPPQTQGQTYVNCSLCQSHLAIAAGGSAHPSGIEKAGQIGAPGPLLSQRQAHTITPVGVPA